MGAGSPRRFYWALLPCKLARRFCGAQRLKFRELGLMLLAFHRPA
jgi:hypothetical protein